MDKIYFDSASTSKPVDSILDAISPYIKEYYFNPSAKYSCSKIVKDKIESVREEVAHLINANPNEIIFNSGATEGNNNVVRGFIDGCTLDELTPYIITTNIEHNSTYSCLLNSYLLNKDMIDPKGLVLHVNKDGLIQMNELHELLQKVIEQGSWRFRILVTICMGNNEIGTIQNIQAISELVHEFDGIVHVDATQCIGHIFVDVQEMGIDILTASAQKFGGLKGTGFMYINNRIEDYIRPLIYGSQENMRRGGTENIIGIVALGEALKYIDYEEQEKIVIARDYLIQEMVNRWGCKVNGTMIGRLPNNINVTFKQNITGEALIYILDSSGIMISAGSACNAHSIQPSRVLQAIGLSDEEIAKSIRITLPDNVTKFQIERTLAEIDKAIQLLTT